jgi:hypothetical protein
MAAEIYTRRQEILQFVGNFTLVQYGIFDCNPPSYEDGILETLIVNDLIIKPTTVQALRFRIG